ncbi:MAG: ATP-binding protein [Candidatus Eremiobacteraeota bacterium]|nr:ATP-binding protein [Candidatus Eremiobacteraeota bacterium]
MASKRNKNEYKTISKKSRSLLKQSENCDLEYKESLNGLKPELLVAFANSEKGGSILIGVKEKSLSNGRQRGEIIGCKVRDKEKQAIFNIAESCIPHINIEVFIENTNATPFFRIEVPGGDKKPYSTSSGIYKIRWDGRNKAILPKDLLNMFMELESQRFFQRFKEATKDMEEEFLKTQNSIEQKLSEVKKAVSEEIEDFQDLLDDIDEKIEAMLSEIQESPIGLIEELFDLSSCGLDAIVSKGENIESWIASIEVKTDLLLNKFGIEDPHITRTRYYVKESAKHLLKMDPILNKDYYLENFTKCFGATEEQIGLWYDEVISELEKES